MIVTESRIGIDLCGLFQGLLSEFPAQRYARHASVKYRAHSPCHTSGRGAHGTSRLRIDAARLPLEHTATGSPGGASRHAPVLQTTF